MSATRPAIPYTHVQTTASTTWTVQHNLGSIPIVDVNVLVSGQYVKIMPLGIENVDENTLVITFSTPREGQARCV